MYCSFCHYGSPSAKFQPTGKVVEVEVTVHKAKQKMTVTEYWCPQCGSFGPTVDKAPYPQQGSRPPRGTTGNDRSRKSVVVVEEDPLPRSVSSISHLEKINAGDDRVAKLSKPSTK